ncbi:MAG: ABC transporter ATP-binding protein/permease, partial [Gammaproteobacteria bacterium]|nr:ABC transporter ATP-binding protein/permease [Gammaproteobacteria bacterium]
MSLPQFGRHASDILATYKHFLIYAQGDRSRFYLDLFTVLGAVITNTAMIWLMGKPLSLIQQGQYDELTLVIIMFVIVVLINQSMQYTGGWLTKWLGLQFIGRTRNALLTRLLYLSFPVVEQTSRGDILARLSNDIEQISHVVVETRIMLFSHVLTLSFYISMLFWINTTLALIALATTPLFFLQQRYFSTRRRHATENLLKRGGVLMGFEEQSLANLRGISSNRSESLVSGLHARTYEKARKWAMRERSLDVGFMVSFTVLIYAVGLLIVLMGVELIKTDTILIGSLVSFLLYLGYLTVPVRGIADAFFQATGNVAAAERVLHMLEQKEAVIEKENAKSLVIDKGNIEIDNLEFAYPDSQPLFHKVDINIPGGATIALVGPSGSGKSTFATLLLRFYDPASGRINIDGQDLRDVSLASLRDNIAVVWQSPFLIVDTIRANLLVA